MFHVKEVKEAYNKRRNSEIVDADYMGDAFMEASATVKFLVFGIPSAIFMAMLSFS